MKHPLRSLLLALVMACAAPAWGAGEPLDINQATAQQLAATLKGVGLAKAQAIVQYRKTYGPFSSIDELAEVKGIGARTIERNRGLIQVVKKAAPAPGSH